jgi:hypothetical protein
MSKRRSANLLRRSPKKLRFEPLWYLTPIAPSRAVLCNVIDMKTVTAVKIICSYQPLAIGLKLRVQHNLLGLISSRLFMFFSFSPLPVSMG